MNSIQFQWHRRRLLAFSGYGCSRCLPPERACPRFSLETAYYNPLCPLRLLPAKVSALFFDSGERRGDRSTTLVLAPRERKERKEESEGEREKKRHILRFYFRFERLSTFPFCVHDGTRVEAAPFIRETSPANQPPFQLEIETRSFEIPLLFRGSSTSSFFFPRFFFDTNARARAIERGRNFFPFFLFSFLFFFLFLRARVLCASILQRSGSKAFFDRLLRSKGFLTRVMLTRSFMTRCLIVLRRANTKYFISLWNSCCIPTLYFYRIRINGYIT